MENRHAADKTIRDVAKRRRAVEVRAFGSVACCVGLIGAPVLATAQPVGPVAARDVVDVAGDMPAAADAPAAADIVGRALDRAARQRESALARHFEFVTAGTVESLDAAGNVTRTETNRRRNYPLEGHFYSELVGRDGRSLDADDARDERKRKAAFVREARRHAARGERYDPNEMHVDFDRELMDRYRTTLAGTDVVRGESCWVIRFEPRDGSLPENRRIDKALNRSTGFLWITRNDYRVARVTFEMQRPFRWLWGIAGTLRRATGRFDLQWIGSDLWMLTDSRVEFDVGVLFGMKSIRRRIRSEWVRPGGQPAVDAEAGLH